MDNLVISSAHLVPYKLRVAPDAPFSQRVGRLLRLETVSHETAWGDIAPLPGFSRETLDDVDAAWNEYQHNIVDEVWPTADFLAPARLSDRLRHFALPSFRFGVEQAITGLTAQALGTKIPEILAPEWRRPLSIAGLITGTGEDACNEASRLAAQGYRAVKVKVGNRPVSGDIDNVLAIRAAVGDEVELRLDANRSWTLDEAFEFVRQTRIVRPAFIEEPVSDLADTRRLWDKTGVPIAFDETLLEIGKDELDQISFATHLVLKPTLLGGIIATEAMVSAGRGLGMIPVVSSAYESGLGISMLACLAARWCPAGPPAGLDTYRRLESDVFADRGWIGPSVRREVLRFELEGVQEIE